MGRSRGNTWGAASTLQHRSPPFRRRILGRPLAAANGPVAATRTMRYDAAMQPRTTFQPRLRAGMVGVGMIFEETYWPLFQQLCLESLYRRDTGPVEVEL